MAKFSDALPTTNYVAGIDGLRALAVIAVILFHLNASLLPGGFVGVDVFFVISGYVISQSLSQNSHLSLSNFLLSFYKRRILRIFPALVTCLFLTGLVSIAFIPHGFWLSEQNRWTGLWAFFGVSNFYLVNSLDGYFSSRTDFNPFVHTWSLGVEEQFYVFFPIILYVVLQEKKRTAQENKKFNAILPTLALISFFWSIHQTYSAHEKAFYLLPSRFWELAAGAFVYQINTHSKFLSNKIRIWATPIGTLLLLTGFVFANKNQFPFPWSIAPILATIFLLIGITTQKVTPPFSPFFTSNSLRYIGRLSYSLYLWHWPVFVLFRWTIGLESFSTMFFALTLTWVLAAISYHGIEYYFRNNAHIKKQTACKIVAGGTFAIAITSVLLGMVYHYSRTFGWSLSVTKNECLWQPYNSSCRPFTNILNADRRLFVIGDSHAGAYKLMAETVANRFGANVHIRSYAGNPLARLIALEDDPLIYKKAYIETLTWLDRYAQPGDIVFLASLRIQRLSNQWGAFDPEMILKDALSDTQKEKIHKSTEYASELIQSLQKRHLFVLMDAPKPVFQAPPFRCADWFNRMNPVCQPGFDTNRDYLLKLREPSIKALEKLAKRHDIAVWDPFPVLCPGTFCSAMVDAQPLFFDGDHLSGYGNKLLVESFSHQLSTIWGSPYEGQ